MRCGDSAIHIYETDALQTIYCWPQIFRIIAFPKIDQLPNVRSYTLYLRSKKISKDESQVEFVS